MIKLFASDLDGTLINALHQTDRAILRRLRRVLRAGRHVALATGRWSATGSELGFGDLPLEVVSANGALVYGTGGGYWDARYETGNPDQGTVYFPKNGMWYGGAAAGTGDTGYYWTQTAALGASGDERGYWLQNMQLSGSNASANRYRIFREGEQDPTGMSVRCVYNSRVVETSHRYECYVKGYTHVFLYYEDAEGGRTYLNTWPGEMISIYDTNALSMYHTFAYESVTDYPELKVVFNLVDNDGKVTTYPDDYATQGGLTLTENQKNNFFDIDQKDKGWIDNPNN